LSCVMRCSTMDIGAACSTSRSMPSR
jgi:hypothetical protein